MGGVAVGVLWDSLDNVRFPRHGMRTEVTYTMFDTSLGSDQDGDLLRVAFDKAYSFGRNTVMLGGSAPSISANETGALRTLVHLGRTDVSFRLERARVDRHAVAVLPRHLLSTPHPAKPAVRSAGLPGRAVSKPAIPGSTEQRFQRVI